jgi:hypothetical protein
MIQVDRRANGIGKVILCETKFNTREQAVPKGD